MQVPRLRELTRAVFNTVFDVRVIGEASTARMYDCAILIATHGTLLDALVLNVVFNNRVRFTSDRNLQKIPVLGILIRWYGVLAVTKNEAHKGLLEEAQCCQQSHEWVGFFPSGRITPSGANDPVLPGFAFLAERLQLPVVPVAIQFSSISSRLRSKRLLRRWSVEVNIGEPYWIGHGRLNAATIKVVVEEAAFKLGVLQSVLEDSRSP